MEIIKPSWDIFKAKYTENPQENFEWFCYLLFCREYNKPNGILRYKNQSGIETNPVELNNEIIGWQSKFYEGKLSTHKDDLIGTLEKSKRDYPNITKIIFYTNLEWTQVHKKKGLQAEKTQAQIDSEKKAEELNIEIEWRTASYFESEFVSMIHKDISKHFFIYESKRWEGGIMDNEIPNKIDMQDVLGVGVVTGGTVTQNITNNNYYPNDTIKTNLKRKYKEVKEFKKAIFTYYSIYGTNFDSFTRATTFDELFNILEKEEVCLYCLLKELGEEYEFLIQPINCDELKVKIESINREEISGLILRINWNKIDKTCTIDGYLRFTSESFEPLKNVYEEVVFNYQTVKDIVEENLESRRHARSIELQLILPNELYDTSMNFQCENNKIKIVKRLLLRIENYTQSDEINEIAFWQRNSNFYQNHQEDNVEDDSFHNIIEEFQEYDDDKHICLLSNICLNASIKEIYDYGVPIAFYSYSKECEIINNLDFTNKKVKNIKNTIFRFMKKNRETHFIYDDYNDLDFLKHESKVEGTEDDYL